MKKRKQRYRLFFVVVVILYTILLFGYNSVYASSDRDVTEQFKDENLRKSIIEQIQKVNGQQNKHTIMASDIEAIASDSLPSGKQLDLSNKGIKNLEGLELFANTGLEWIYLDWNEIQDITPLANITSLTKISLNHNEVNDITALKELINLTNLSLNSNQISDIIPITNLTKLSYLSINDNQISSTTELNWPSLIEVSVSGNKLNSIGELLKCERLEQIDASRNQIASLEDIPKQNKLIKLNVNYNLLQNLSGIEKLNNLKIFSSSNNQIREIGALKNQTLENINLNANQIQDVSVLNTLPNLKLLYLDKNQIFDFSVLANLKNMNKYTIYHQTDCIEIKQKLEKDYAQIGMPDLFSQLFDKQSNVYQENLKIEVTGSNNSIVSDDYTNITFPKKDLEKGVTIIVSDDYNTIFSYSVETDKTPPTITGVENETGYKKAICPVSMDTDIAKVTLVKNGEEICYSLGEEIKEEGEYILTVEDRAGNKTVLRFYLEYTIQDDIKDYIIRDGAILNIRPKTTVTQMKEKLNSNLTYQVYRKSKLLDEDSYIATDDRLIASNGKTYSLIVLGDVNYDGIANIKDLIQVRKYIIGYQNLQGNALKAADINLDNQINIKDVVKLRKLILEM